MLFMHRVRISLILLSDKCKQIVMASLTLVRFRGCKVWIHMYVCVSNYWLVSGYLLQTLLFFTHSLLFISYFYNVTDKITIATMNCQGLATTDKRKDVINYYEQNFSIIVYKKHILPLNKKHSLNHNGDTNAILILICQIPGVWVFPLTIWVQRICRKKDSGFRSVHWRQQDNPYKHIWPNYS